MPYNPGIQDISGQLIAQGMSQASAARARAMENIGQSISSAITSGFKQYQQNQFLTKQAVGKFGGQLQDPNFKSYVDSVLANDPRYSVPPELKKALQNFSSGKTDIYDAALLGNMADAYQENVSRQFIQAQTNRVMQETEQAKLAAKRLGFLSEILRIPQEQPTGMPAAASAVAVPGAQAQMPRAAAPAAALVEGAAAPMESKAPVVPSIAPNLTPSAEPLATPRSAPDGSVFVPPNVQNFLQSSLGPFNADIAEAARREAVVKFLTKGEYVDPTIIAQRLAVEQRRQQAEEREMTLDQANKAAETFNASQIDKPYGQRRFASVKPTTRPGFSTLEISLAEMTQAEKEASAANTEDQKLRLGRINTTINEDRKAASLDRLLAPAVGNLESMLEEKELEEGSLAPLRARIRGVAKSLGYPVDEAALSSAQTANAFFGQVLIPLFINTKGATSDRDAQLFASWSPQLGLNDKANMMMLNVISRRFKLGRSLEKLADEYDAGKIKSGAYVERRGKLIEDYDSQVPTVDEFRQRAGLPERKIAETVTEPVVPRGALDAAINAAKEQGASAASNMFNVLMSKGKKPPTK